MVNVVLNTQLTCEPLTTRAVSTEYLGSLENFLAILLPSSKTKLNYNVLTSQHLL